MPEPSGVEAYCDHCGYETRVFDTPVPKCPECADPEYPKQDGLGDLFGDDYTLIMEGSFDG